MTLDLWMLFGACVLGLVHLSAASFTFKAQAGNKYTVGPRDEDIKPTGMAGRMYRAQWNFLETFPIFAALVLMVHVTGAAGFWSALGAQIYLAGRVAFLPFYAWGVPWLRTFAWNIATTGLVVVAIDLFV